jgi:O-glycosyl hydrolase
LSNEAAVQQKPLWVTEYGDGDGTGLTMARRIHDDITDMGVRAWVYWQVVDNATGWGFLYNPLVATNTSGYTTNYTINEKFYVMGQFSEFIRPGCKIISVNDTNTLAAYTATNSTLVLVMVNTNSTSLNVTYNVSAFGSVPWQIDVFQTAPGKNLASLSPLVLTNQQFTSAIPAQSVTTFVLRTNMLTIASPGGNQAELNWSYGTLQSATNVTGPYHDITNAIQPFTIPATNVRQFYRVREN